MKTVRAKFKVAIKQECPSGAIQVHMHAVYSSDPNHENKAFTDATPSGNFAMNITKPETADFFEIGQEYYLDFQKA